MGGGKVIRGFLDPGAAQLARFFLYALMARLSSR